MTFAAVAGYTWCVVSCRQHDRNDSRLGVAWAVQRNGGGQEGSLFRNRDNPCRARLALHIGTLLVVSCQLHPRYCTRLTCRVVIIARERGDGRGIPTWRRARNGPRILRLRNENALANHAFWNPSSSNCFISLVAGSAGGRHVCTHPFQSIGMTGNPLGPTSFARQVALFLEQDGKWSDQNGNIVPPFPMQSL
jgi:hypothetical protein